MHARDIVEELYDARVASTNDFKWQMQLRYYWNDDDDVCAVRQTNSRFEYAYEYLGAQSRLVVTPMTDRCYMTLTGAMHPEARRRARWPGGHRQDGVHEGPREGAGRAVRGVQLRR